jgi:hypothetical protein
MARFDALLCLSFVLCLFLVSPAFLSCQQPRSDPQAVAYASQSIAALTGGTSINDVTLSGTVTWNAAGGDTGTAPFVR